MRSIGLKGVVMLAVSLSFTACSSAKQQAHSSPAMSQSAPASSAAQTATPASAGTRSGTFEGLNGKHVAGATTVNADQVVLSDFTSDAGPDLHLYLANGTDEKAVAAGKELGLVAADKASQTFTISGSDASKYTVVAINCDKAKAVFGAASLR